MNKTQKFQLICQLILFVVGRLCDDLTWHGSDIGASTFTL